MHPQMDIHKVHRLLLFRHMSVGHGDGWIDGLDSRCRLSKNCEDLQDDEGGVVGYLSTGNALSASDKKWGDYLRPARSRD
jgi:hypothetical protein